jgi:hypothetical protein
VQRVRNIYVILGSQQNLIPLAVTSPAESLMETCKVMSFAPIKFFVKVRQQRGVSKSAKFKVRFLDPLGVCSQAILWHVYVST